MTESRSRVSAMAQFFHLVIPNIRPFLIAPRQGANICARTREDKETEGARENRYDSAMKTRHIEIYLIYHGTSILFGGSMETVARIANSSTNIRQVDDKSVACRMR